MQTTSERSLTYSGFQVRRLNFGIYQGGWESVEDVNDDDNDDGENAQCFKYLGSQVQLLNFGIRQEGDAPSFGRSMIIDYSYK